KADREGADRLVADIEGALALKSWKERWKPPVLTSVAIRGEGLAEVEDVLGRHYEWLSGTGQLEVRRREAARARILELTREAVTRAIMERVAASRLEALTDAVLSGKESPYRAAERWAAELLKGGQE